MNTLPENLTNYLQTQIESGHYATPSDLIQADRDRQAHLEPSPSKASNPAPPPP